MTEQPTDTEFRPSAQEPQSIRPKDVCFVMAFLSALGGAAGAMALGKVEVVSRYGANSETYEPALVIPWLVAGLFGAVFWWVLGEMAGALHRIEMKSTEQPDAPGCFPPVIERPNQVHQEGREPQASHSQKAERVAYTVLAILGLVLIAYLAATKE